MSDPLLPANDAETRRLIQRWIGAEQSGNLNDPQTVRELLKDVVGLEDYLLEKQRKQSEGQRIVDLRPSPEPTVVESRVFSETDHYTPNKGGGSFTNRGVLWHASYGSPAGTVSWIKQAKARVSYHVVIFPDGGRHNIVPLNQRAWHAGISTYKGRSGCNGFLTGVAFTGNTYDRSLTEAELASALEFVRKHKDTYGWTYDWVTDHRTVSPGRKPDLNPGEFKRLQNVLKAAF